MPRPPTRNRGRGKKSQRGAFAAWLCARPPATCERLIAPSTQQSLRFTLELDAASHGDRPPVPRSPGRCHQEPSTAQANNGEALPPSPTRRRDRSEPWCVRAARRAGLWSSPARPASRAHPLAIPRPRERSLAFQLRSAAIARRRRGGTQPRRSHEVAHRRRRRGRADCRALLLPRARAIPRLTIRPRSESQALATLRSRGCRAIATIDIEPDRPGFRSCDLENRWPERHATIERRRTAQVRSRERAPPHPPPSPAPKWSFPSPNNPS
jgi:hypothetical protein